MKKILPAFLSLIFILGIVAFLYLNYNEPEAEIHRSTSYIASSELSATIYREEDSVLYEYTQLTRGTAVTSRNIQDEVNDGAYIFTEIELDGETDENGDPIIYYISGDYLTDSLEDVVREDTKYVRTSVTVYTNDNDAQISSFLKKGTELNIGGYSGLNADGSVEMYKISNEGSEGYVYAKYLVDTQEEADAVFEQVAATHSGREYTFELYGGSTDSLDWYPVTKEELSSGPLLQEAKAMYLNSTAIAAENVDAYISLAAASGVNAVVVDIKDGILAYQSSIAAELSPSSYDTALLTTDEYGSSIQKLKDAGLYVIGRIVTFSDDYYAADHTEDCIVSDGEAVWPSAYSRNCWYYNVALAQEAVGLFGFNEIQFDYVRFPENAFSMSEAGTADFKNTYNEEKAEAIQNFCFYAADQMHKVGAYISVDVFGECVGEYVTAYGQYWPAISNVVDVISGMPYTDHYGEETDTWTYPYTTVYEWAVQAAMRQTEIWTPATARTWITGYDTPNWDPVVTYGAEQLMDQAQALYNSGLTGGFIPWNGASDIAKYTEYAAVWSSTY